MDASKERLYLFSSGRWTRKFCLLSWGWLSHLKQWQGSVSQSWSCPHNSPHKLTPLNEGHCNCEQKKRITVNICLSPDCCWCAINNNNEISYHAVIFSMTSASVSSSSSLSILSLTTSQLRVLFFIVMWEMQLSLHSEDKQSKNTLHHSWGNLSFHSSSVSWSRTPWSSVSQPLLGDPVGSQDWWAM